MYKTILFLLLIMVDGTYYRIKKFRVTDIVDDFLIRNDIIKKNKNLEYQLKGSGKLHKLINENTLVNQIAVADFLTDVFDYIKNSSFKI